MALRRAVRARVREARIAATTMRAPKHKPKVKVKPVRYRCGNCGKLGHNARTCPVCFR